MVQLAHYISTYLNVHYTHMYISSQQILNESLVHGSGIWMHPIMALLYQSAGQCTNHNTTG